jgi:hypothetical protein
MPLGGTGIDYVPMEYSVWIPWIQALIAAAVLWVSYLVWRLHKHQTFLTGAMESHSTAMLRIEARSRKARPKVYAALEATTHKNIQ